MTQLWIKNGGAPQELPFMDAANNSVYSDLANNPEGREACGWAAAPEQPEHDPDVSKLEWVDGGWEVVSITPVKVTRHQAKEALRRAGHLSAILAYIPTVDDGGELALFWSEAEDFHRNHPQLLKVGDALGLTSAQIDALFVVAHAIG